MTRFDGCDREFAAVALGRAAQDQWDRLLLLDDAGRLVVLSALPADPQPKRGDDQRREADDFTERDPAAAGLGVTHRPPASSKRRGAASSQLAAMRSATWSQSTASPRRLTDTHPDGPR